MFFSLALNNKSIVKMLKTLMLCKVFYGPRLNRFILPTAQQRTLFNKIVQRSRRSTSSDTRQRGCLFSKIEEADVKGVSNFIEDIRSKGANALKLALNARDGNGFTPLMKVVSLPLSNKAKNDLLEILLAIPETSVNASDSWGRTSLHLASQNNDTSSVRHLLRRGALTEVCDNDYFYPVDYTSDINIERALHIVHSVNPPRVGPHHQLLRPSLTKIYRSTNSPLPRIFYLNTVGENGVNNDNQNVEKTFETIGENMVTLPKLRSHAAHTESQQQPQQSKHTNSNSNLNSTYTYSPYDNFPEMNQSLKSSYCSLPPKGEVEVLKGKRNISPHPLIQVQGRGRGKFRFPFLWHALRKPIQEKLSSSKIQAKLDQNNSSSKQPGSRNFSTLIKKDDSDKKKLFVPLTVIDSIAQPNILRSKVKAKANDKKKSKSKAKKARVRVELGPSEGMYFKPSLDVQDQMDYSKLGVSLEASSDYTEVDSEGVYDGDHYSGRYVKPKKNPYSPPFVPIVPIHPFLTGYRSVDDIHLPNTKDKEGTETDPGDMKASSEKKNESGIPKFRGSLSEVHRMFPLGKYQTKLASSIFFNDLDAKVDAGVYANADPKVDAIEGPLNDVSECWKALVNDASWDVYSLRHPHENHTALSEDKDANARTPNNK
jgi:hypothetical protein